MSHESPITVAFDQLFNGLGTLDLEYSAGAASLDGRWIEIEGYLATGHTDAGSLLLIDTPGACPDCSLPPVATMRLSGITDLPAAIVPGQTRVTCNGRVSFGFEIETDGTASFLRLADARLVRISATKTDHVSALRPPGIPSTPSNRD